VCRLQQPPRRQACGDQYPRCGHDALTQFCSAISTKSIIYALGCVWGYALTTPWWNCSACWCRTLTWCRQPVSRPKSWPMCFPTLQPPDSDLVVTQTQSSVSWIYVALGTCMTTLCPSSCPLQTDMCDVRTCGE
jgi:hypothetical protein